jgi:diguanylate cyclase (GGDEF)-like protein
MTWLVLFTLEFLLGNLATVGSASSVNQARFGVSDSSACAGRNLCACFGIHLDLLLLKLYYNVLFDVTHHQTRENQDRYRPESPGEDAHSVSGKNSTECEPNDETNDAGWRDIDIDHFDLFNITHGHYLGDSLLRSCAKLFDESLTGDHKGFAWRSGPDEFISIIISDDVDIQLSVFEELHSKLNRLQFTDKGIDDIHCSMSVIESSSDFEETVNRLYRALDVIKNTAGKAIHVNR